MRGATSKRWVATPLFLTLRHDEDASFGAHTAVQRRRRRFFDRDEQVAFRFFAVLQLGETHAAEETERREAALALVDRLQPERIAGTDLQLALDRLGAGSQLPTISTWSTKTCAPSWTA